ncbi:hypothetical protein FUA23_00205 [Neolewinella aurantiaca]|uniref:Uncharacterized protein n=1 Tax=Neolewinella aurantiaca TaxID=2602767 RepID=A0A5C7FJZ3_9BACT|nr:hypothetical protein [Neolewinella aurantiaca]TXF91639.1 hypothetical protein FUA23_00205 [Neolewinella aurantiaca]
MNTILMILGQVIIYGLLLLFDEYAGFMLAVILGSIAFFVWLISYIVEWIQPSRVTHNYYGFVLSCWVGPLIALLGFIALRGEVGWLS